MKNVINIISDQMRWDVLPCNGADFIHAPNFARLAHQSVNFSCAYSGNPVFDVFEVAEEGRLELMRKSGLISFVAGNSNEIVEDLPIDPCANFQSPRMGRDGFEPS